MGNDDFLAFVVNPSRENFLASRQRVLEHPDYNPYSDDLETMQQLLAEKKWEAITGYDTINTLLSPRAHLIKRFAWRELGGEEAERGERTELLLAQRIMEAIALTGNGSLEQPYTVTRITDERDMLRFFEEEFAGQALLSRNGKHLDRISTRAGREIYFDITDCYLRLAHIQPKLPDALTQKPAKKWWKFW